MAETPESEGSSAGKHQGKWKRRIWEFLHLQRPETKHSESGERGGLYSSGVLPFKNKLNLRRRWTPKVVVFCCSGGLLHKVWHSTRRTQRRCLVLRSLPHPLPSPLERHRLQQSHPVVSHLVIANHGQSRSTAVLSNIAVHVELYPPGTVLPGVAAVAASSSSSWCLPGHTPSQIYVAPRALVFTPAIVSATVLPAFNRLIALGATSAHGVGADREVHPEQVVVRAVCAAGETKSRRGGGQAGGRSTISSCAQGEDSMGWRAS